MESQARVTSAMATPSKRARPETFSVGEEVLAQWPAHGRDSKWHGGKVEAVNPDGTFAVSYEELVRINPSVAEASMRTTAEGKGGAAAQPGRIQCCSIALEIVSDTPTAKAPLAELVQALQRSADVQAELRALCNALGADDCSAGFKAPPPPPTEGAPRPSARGGTSSAAVSTDATPPPKAQPQRDIFLGDARSLSVPGPNLQAAERLRAQLAGVVESDKEGVEEGTAPGADPAAAAATSGAAALPPPSTLLASTFFMPGFEGADPEFKNFLTSRLVYNYGQRDLQVRFRPLFARQVLVAFCWPLLGSFSVANVAGAGPADHQLGSAKGADWGGPQACADAHDVRRQLPAARLAARLLGAARQADGGRAVLAPRCDVHASRHARGLRAVTRALPRRERPPEHRGRVRLG